MDPTCGKLIYWSNNDNKFNLSNKKNKFWPSIFLYDILTSIIIAEISTFYKLISWLWCVYLVTPFLILYPFPYNDTFITPTSFQIAVFIIP